MKNIFKSLMLVAVAAMGFACQENLEENFAPINPNEVVMTITADADETRTWIDETNNKVQWSEGDQLKVIENDAVYRTTTNTTIEGGKAQFTVSFPTNTSASEFTYSAIYPASAVVEDDAEKIDAAKIKVIVNTQQVATATSFDPAADILVAKQVVTDAQPTALNMQFKRLVSLGKLTVNKLPDGEKITKVEFTAGANDVLAGRNYVNATTGKVSEYGYNSKTNTIVVNYNEAISTRDIYFACNPFTMEAGETFKVKVVCEDNTYTKEFTIADGRSLTFTEGNLGTFSVDMTGATVETSFSFADGNYAVIAMSGSESYAMKGVKGSSDYMAYEKVIYDGVATTFPTNDETLVWNIVSVDGGYTFQNHEGKYLYWANKNNAYLGDAQILTITPVENKNYYNVAVQKSPERLLGFNSNSGQERYAFYTGTQVHNLYIVPVVEDTTPRITVDRNSLSYTADGGTYNITLTLSNLDNDSVSVSIEHDWLTYTVSGNTYSFTAKVNESTEERKTTITFKAEGADNVGVSVVQGGKSTTVGEQKEETLSFSTTANRTEKTGTIQVWSQNGITLTNNKAASTSNVGDYSNPARFYQSSEIIVTATGVISKIIFECNSAEYATYLNNSISTISGTSVSVSSKNVTVTFSTAVESFKIEKLAKQVRLNSVRVTYLH